MSSGIESRGLNDSSGPPQLRRDEQGEIIVGSLAELIEWFLNYDQRVAIIRHPRVEEIFQWKQDESRRSGEEVYEFNRAEDRLALGLFQALAEHATEHELHEWIGQLLNVLDESTKANESVSEAFGFDAEDDKSAVSLAAKLPTQRERMTYLTSCWLEALCTAEVRVLGWVYRELYGRAFHPENTFGAGVGN